MKTGLYTGRFQPFHLGHLSLLRWALKDVDKLYIALGSTQYSNEPLNPLSGEERERIVREVIKEQGLEHRCQVFQVPDIHDDDAWTAHVRSIVPPFDVVFVGDDGLVKELFEKDTTSVKLMKHEVDISATGIRDAILKGENWQKWVTPKTAEILRELGFEERVKASAA